MKYRVGITESVDSQSGIAFDLPGCATAAPSRAALDALLPLVIAEHLAWLRRHGEHIDVATAVEFDVTEIVDAEKVDAQDGEFCFDDDMRPLTSDDLARGIRVLSYSRADLLETIGLPDAVLDWRPPPSAMARIDPWKPQPLTIREIVSDIASAEGYYAGCLADGMLAEVPESLAHDLAVQRERAISALQSLADADLGRMFLPQTPWGETPEHWTGRKVLRRIISHERFHTAEIRQRLAWLHLGVPEFGAR